MNPSLARRLPVLCLLLFGCLLLLRRCSSLPNPAPPPPLQVTRSNPHGAFYRPNARGTALEISPFSSILMGIYWVRACVHPSPNCGEHDIHTKMKHARIRTHTHTHTHQQTIVNTTTVSNAALYPTTTAGKQHLTLLAAHALNDILVDFAALTPAPSIRPIRTTHTHRPLPLLRRCLYGAGLHRPSVSP